MKVAFVPEYGPPEVVTFREVPMPTPGPGEVRVRIHATTVTAGDWRVRSGILPRGFGLLRGLAIGFGGPRQGVLGTNAAGVIDAIGPDVTAFAVGDRVLVFPGTALGGHAEAIVISATGRIVRIPSGFDFAQAVALPFGGMTALDFLRRANLRPGERVLVNGASGDVGSAAVQLAKHLGAVVTGVCSARNADLVRSLGADAVIDYAITDFAAADEEDRYDVIVDTVGNAPYSRVEKVLAPGGRLLAVLADLPAVLSAKFVGRRKRHRVLAGPAEERVEDLRTLAELASRGAIKPVISARLPFAQIADAYRIVDSGRKQGSVVLSVAP